MLASGEADGIRLLTQACDAGIAVACENLGTAYVDGKLAPVDDARAVELYRRACNLPAPECSNLAGRLLEGRGVERSPDQAVAVLEKACGHSAKACEQVGDLLARGEEVPTDHVRAKRAFEAGCKHGSGFASGWLGELYYHGRGTPKDTAAAIESLGKACTLNEPLACGMLARHYRNQDEHDSALEMASRGCTLGHEESCAILKELSSP